MSQHGQPAGRGQSSDRGQADDRTDLDEHGESRRRRHPDEHGAEPRLDAAQGCHVATKRHAEEREADDAQRTPRSAPEAWSEASAAPGARECGRRGAAHRIPSMMNHAD
jgi:hypothetical protein